MSDPTLQFVVVVDAEHGSASRFKKIGLGWAMALRRLHEAAKSGPRLSGSLAMAAELKSGMVDFLADRGDAWASSTAIREKCLHIAAHLGHAPSANDGTRSAAAEGWPCRSFDGLCEGVTRALGQNAAEAPTGVRRLLIVYSDLLDDLEFDFFERAMSRVEALRATNARCLFVGYEARDESRGCAAGWRLAPHDLRSATAVAEHAVQILERFALADWARQGAGDITHAPTNPANVHLGCDTCGSIAATASRGQICTVCGRGRFDWIEADPPAASAPAASPAVPAPPGAPSRGGSSTAPRRPEGTHLGCSRCGSAEAASDHGELCAVCGVGRMDWISDAPEPAPSAAPTPVDEPSSHVPAGDAGAGASSAGGSVDYPNKEFAAPLMGFWWLGSSATTAWLYADVLSPRTTFYIAAGAAVAVSIPNASHARKMGWPTRHFLADAFGIVATILANLALGRLLYGAVYWPLVVAGILVLIAVKAPLTPDQTRIRNFRGRLNFFARTLGLCSFITALGTLVFWLLSWPVIWLWKAIF